MLMITWKSNSFKIKFIFESGCAKIVFDKHVYIIIVIFPKRTVYSVPNALKDYYFSFEASTDFFEMMLNWDTLQ